MEKVEYIVGYCFEEVQKTPSFEQLGVDQQQLQKMIISG